MATDEAANPKEPYWLLWAREIQALAQTGLAFTRDQYDASVTSGSAPWRLKS